MGKFQLIAIAVSIYLLLVQIVTFKAVEAKVEKIILTIVFLLTVAFVLLVGFADMIPREMIP